MWVLTLWAPQAECLWDESLPVEVRELPADLAELDRVLGDPELMMVLLECWRQEIVATGRAVLTDGRPTIAMETYVRLMVLKARYRWGYRVLVAEVSDSIHLRRFCRISLSERVPDESTVRKLTRRIGAEAVNELTRALIETAVREKRLRPRAVRVDSTVVEADVRYPTDADLASHGVMALAREGRKLAGLVKERTARVRDRSRSMGRKLRALTRTVRRRSGEAKAEVLALTDRRASCWSAPSRKPGCSPRSPSVGRWDGARPPSVAPPSSFTSWRTAARRLLRRSPSGSRASRSATGSSRWPIRTPGRSARASSASPTCADSATMPMRLSAWR
ncbi:MAG: transposase [Solirubrobacteraceae bacterium]